MEQLNEILNQVTLALSGLQLDSDAPAANVSLSRSDYTVRINIPSLAKNAWASFMFDLAGRLDESGGEQYKIALLPHEELDWEWFELEGVQVGVLLAGQLQKESKTLVSADAKLVGAFAFAKQGVEIFEYYVRTETEMFQGEVSSKDGVVTVKVGQRVGDKLKLSVELGSVSCTMRGKPEILPGDVVSYAASSPFSVALNVDGSPVALGEARWVEGGVAIDLVASV